MTVNARVVAEAREDLGCRESPPRSNDGACVNRLQASTGAFNLAWCVSAVVSWWERSGIDVAALRTAGTADLVERARREGRLRPEPVEGCAVVWNPGPSGHTEIFIRWISKALGQALTIGGNTGDAVREHIRDVRVGRDFFVVPDELEAPAPVFDTVYWWEDPKAEPVRHQLRNTRAASDRDVEEWVAKNGNPGHVRRGTVKITRGGRKVDVFTFWTGPRKRSPDFIGKIDGRSALSRRNASMRKVARERPGHIIRPRSKRVRIA